jgi:radical SAM superfamily enzyme YgiQ (UPF0313 family)
MNKITLINIAISQDCAGKIVYERNSAGMYYLISALKEKNIEVNFFEFFLDWNLKIEEEIENFIKLVENSYNVIGIGCHSIHLPFVIEICQKIKTLYPEKKIILGGIGPSCIAKEIIENFDFIDLVIKGEAEQTLPQLFLKKFNLANIEGVVYRNNGEVIENPIKNPILNLDELPSPDYSSLDFNRYKVITLISTRGCPYGCPFCSLHEFWGKKVRFKSIENLIKEIILLKEKYHQNTFFFGDPTFVLDKQRVLRFCQILKSKGLKVKWEALVRVDLMDEELMNNMSQAGCTTVFYGIESGSNRVLNKIKSGFNIKDALNIIEKSKKYFSIVEASFIWGFPFETFDDFMETIKVYKILRDEYNCQVQLRWLEPYPNTIIYHMYKELLFLPEDLSILYQPEILKEEIKKLPDFYNKDNFKLSKIPSNVTSVRQAIATSHTALLTRELIKKYPFLFSDYYRLKTPDLEKKLKIALEISPY